MTHVKVVVRCPLLVDRLGHQVGQKQYRSHK